MSDDLIKRSDAIKATWQEPTYTDPLNILTEVRDRIETIPSADRPQGEWIEHKERTIVMNNNFVDFFPTEYECSNCGLREAHFFINSKPHNYCPNCGAKMDGERKESE